jgi:hypothetical protein
MSSALEVAREHVRDALARCPTSRPLQLRVEHVLGMLDAAMRLHRGEGVAIEAAREVLLELERVTRKASPQRELFTLDALERGRFR